MAHLDERPERIAKELAVFAQEARERAPDNHVVRDQPERVVESALGTRSASRVGKVLRRDGLDVVRAAGGERRRLGRG